MPITTLSSREFNQDVGRAKRAAENGPVYITHRNKPAHVLLTIEEYRRMTDKKRNIVEMLAMDDDIEFDLPERTISIRPAVFD